MLAFYRLLTNDGKLEIFHQERAAEDLKSLGLKVSTNSIPSFFNLSNPVATLDQVPPHILLLTLVTSLIFLWSSIALVHVHHDKPRSASSEDITRLILANHSLSCLYCSSGLEMDDGESEIVMAVVVIIGSHITLDSLLVDWEPGVAYRLGVAMIDKNAWDGLETG